MNQATDPSSDPEYVAMLKHYTAYEAERDQHLSVNPTRIYTSAEIDWILDRLSFWSGLFSAYLPRAVEYEVRNELAFPHEFLKMMYDITKLQLAFTQRKHRTAPAAPAAHAAAPAPAPAPAPKPAAPAARKMTVQEEVALNDRRISEEMRTQTNKSFDLSQLKRNFLLSDRSFAVVGDFGPDKCGAIHPSCGHEMTGRCNLKMAHSVVSNQPLHHCSQCGQNFTR
jgi:hypothetical protein